MRGSATKRIPDGIRIDLNHDQATEGRARRYDDVLTGEDRHDLDQGDVRRIPPCRAADADPAYMGYLTDAELVGALNELLEAARAGAIVTLASAREAGDSEVATLLAAIHRDEAHWCAELIAAIRRAGGTPGDAVGGFAEKAMAIGDMTARVAFLNRGQAWVVRRVAELAPKVRDDATHAMLRKMKQGHEENIARAAGEPCTGSSR